MKPYMGPQYIKYIKEELFSVGPDFTLPTLPLCRSLSPHTIHAEAPFWKPYTLHSLKTISLLSRVYRRIVGSENGPCVFPEKTPRQTFSHLFCP